jgi:threonine/homoserine/homoserine lactone efflux protein
MLRTADYFAELIAGFIALALIGADVYLTVHGTIDSGLQAAVPIIVAFYFGGRASTKAWEQRRKVEATAAANGSSEDA